MKAWGGCEETCTQGLQILAEEWAEAHNTQDQLSGRENIKATEGKTSWGDGMLRGAEENGDQSSLSELASRHAITDFSISAAGCRKLALSSVL